MKRLRDALPASGGDSTDDGNPSDDDFQDEEHPIMDIRAAATIAAGASIAAAGIGLGVLAGRADQADLYNPIAMTAAGGNPVGLMANGTFMLGLGGLMGAGAIGMRLGHPSGSAAGSAAILLATIGAGPAAWLAAELVDGD